MGLTDSEKLNLNKLVSNYTALETYILDRVRQVEAKLETAPISTSLIGVNIDSKFVMRLDQLLAVIIMLNQGRRINAIKEIRTIFPHMGLKEAKDIAEGIRAQLTFSLAKSFTT